MSKSKRIDRMYNMILCVVGVCFGGLFLALIADAPFKDVFSTALIVVLCVGIIFLVSLAVYNFVKLRKEGRK